MPVCHIQSMIEDGVNKNLDDKNIKYLNEINDIGVYEKGGETKDIENENVTHRDITVNEQETDQDTLIKRI